MRLYQIYDRVSGGVTGGIFAYQHDAPARRVFYDWLKNPNVGPGAHAADFDLLFLGDQQENGCIESVMPTAVSFGSDWVEQQKVDGNQLSLMKEGK